MRPASESSFLKAMPRVSVVLPAYNGGATLSLAVRSVASQDYRPLDLIVMDDASKDPAAALVEPAIRGLGLETQIVRHSANQGLARTLNDGWRRTTGDLVLFIHQDIELVGSDWVRRAVGIMTERDDVQIVTSHYGVAAEEELSFAARAFGFIRRQFHQAPARLREPVTFTEFKCDLVRRAALERVGGFPTTFRIAGEDIVVSYCVRQAGGTILKAYDLKAVQRFEGTAGSIRGNLWKEYRFGMAYAGVLLAFRGYALRDLNASAHTRARSWHRASQPPIAAAELVLLLLGVIAGWGLALWLLAGLLVVRFVAYSVHLWPDFRRVVRARGRAASETVAAATLGLLTDIVYPAGLGVGLVRRALGAPV